MNFSVQKFLLEFFCILCSLLIFETKMELVLLCLLVRVLFFQSRITPKKAWVLTNLRAS